ncbi:hypothetical protein [Paraburkholderia bannensis]|uniref:hypothetical protein n=1 Tax=Paraburkholderia bannensis TaxID=765414 RepID=UPI002ABE16CE|nr:hypothetical protein [Paraburkholderia bannensis]
MKTHSFSSALAAQFGHTSTLMTLRYLNAAYGGMRNREILILIKRFLETDVIATEIGITRSAEDSTLSGLTRGWHDLDRDSALSAHFTAADGQLKS